MALLPYSVRQVTQRSRGGRRDRDRMPEVPRDGEAAVGAGVGDGGAEAPVPPGEPGEGEPGGEAAAEVAADAIAADAEAASSPDGEDES
jgi:hypothetical protein